MQALTHITRRTHNTHRGLRQRQLGRQLRHGCRLPTATAAAGLRVRVARACGVGLDQCGPASTHLPLLCFLPPIHTCFSFPFTAAADEALLLAAALAPCFFAAPPAAEPEPPFFVDVGFFLAAAFFLPTPGAAADAEEANEKADEATIAPRALVAPPDRVQCDGKGHEYGANSRIESATSD